MRLLLELSNFVTNYTKILCFLQCNLLFYSFVLFVLLFNTWLLYIYCNPGTSLRGHSGEWDDKRPDILMGPQKTNIFKWWWRRVDAVCFRLDALDGFSGEVMSEPRPEDRKGIGWVKIWRSSSAKHLRAEIRGYGVWNLLFMPLQTLFWFLFFCFLLHWSGSWSEDDTGQSIADLLQTQSMHGR